MPTLKDLENSDENNNPSAQAARDLVSREKSAGSAEASGGAASSSSADNINDVRNKEETPDQGFYNPGGGKEKGQTVSLKTILKKRGPLAAIITLGLGLPTFLAIILSPALLLQQLSETLTGKFNDQLGALDVRSTLLLKKKYSSELTKGSCGTVTIRCRYQSIRENSGLAKRLKNAGVEINGEKSIIPGRIKPTEFVYEGRTISAKNLLKEAKTDPGLRKALRKGYDPLFAGFSDKIAAKVRIKLGIKKSSNVKSSTNPDDMDEELKKTAAGTIEAPPDGQPLTKRTDEDGKVTYTDSTGKVYPEEAGARINKALANSVDQAKLAERVSKAGVKSGIKGALTVTAFGAGAVDSLCTAYVMIRVAGFAAKVYQQRQLIAYSYEFVKASHEQKYGSMTAEEMSYFGNKLTKVNSEGKAALDSDGFKFAAYGDTFTPGNFDTDTKGSSDDAVAQKVAVQNETSRYVNGQLLNDNVMSKLVNAISGGPSGTVDAADKVCSFTKSWKGQTLVFGLAVAGLVVGFFTGGVSVGAGAVLQGAASVAISVAFALIQPKLIDMAKGEVIKGDENGNETGNAITSGMGGYNAQTAQGRGLRVASQSAYSAYINTSNQVAAKYAQEDRESRSPFDPSSPNTFLGSVVASILPYSTKMQTAGSSGLAMASMIGGTLSSLGTSKKVSAATDGDQFVQCNDTEYKNYAADPFCNLRYMLPDLNTDPDAVLDYMIQGGYISETDPTPQGAYADYVTRCIDRESSIGDPFNAEGGDGDPGEDCVVGQGGENEKRNTMFSLFYVDSSVDEGFDNDFDQQLNAGLEGGTEFRVASFNVRGASHDGEQGTPPWEGRIKTSADVIQSNNFDIVGFQEFEPRQYNYIKTHLTDYELSTHGKQSDSIMWNKAKFTKVGQGTWKTIYFGGPIQEPWVKLQDNTTQQEFYVLNVHDPINKGQGNAESRYANAKAHLALINNLKADAPVVFTGDFNSAYTRDRGAGAKVDDKLTYCVLTQGGLNDAYDLSLPRQAKCPNPTKGSDNHIDHIYLTPEIQVKLFDTKPVGYASNGSDHPTIYADAIIPGSGASTGAGTTFIAATYNQPIRGNSSVAASKILENKFDIVGMQELGGDNYFNIKSTLAKKGYKVYPSINKGENNSGHCSNARPIFYNESGSEGTNFRLVKSEIFDVPSYETTKASSAAPEYVNPQECGNSGEMTKGGGRANIPVVWLQDSKTGQIIIYMNTHNLANCCGSAGVASKKRLQAAEIYIAKIKELKTENPGVPIFFSGDFNEGTGVRYSGNVTLNHDHNNLLYCKLTQSKLLFRAVGGRDQPCKDDHEGIGGVDYVYATPGVKVEWNKEFKDPSTNDSPHMVPFGKLTVPGSGGDAKTVDGPISKDGWAWPVPSLSTKTRGILGYGARGSKGIHKGIDIGESGGASLGKTVVAAHDGTINRVWGESDACGTYISLKATGTPYYAAYQHVRNVKVRQGDTVKAGQAIAEIGKQGGSTCGSSGFYHLHFSVESKPGMVSAYANSFPNGTIDPDRVLPK